MRKTLLLAAITAVAGLSACDKIDSDLERVAVGAAIGCAAGEIFVDGKCVEGAVIGGATGAVADDF